jgi:cell division initiation protein
MRITPLEIRQKNFEKKLRGYDKDEVNAFLQTMSAEWERMVDENKELKIKLDQSEKEVFWLLIKMYRKLIHVYQQLVKVSV